jgi:hypothetical protein
MVVSEALMSQGRMSHDYMLFFQTECSRDGGHLPEPDTPEKFDSLVAFIKQLGPAEDYASTCNNTLIIRIMLMLVQ